MQVAGLEYCPNHGEYHCIVSDHVIDLYRAFRDQLIWTTCSVYHMSLQFMDQNRLRNTVSCHFRLAGVSGHTGRDWANVVSRRSTELPLRCICI